MTLGAFPGFWLLLLSLLPVENNDNPGKKIDARALAALVQAAEASHSDALVVLKDGQLVGEWYFGHPIGPIEAMSDTKSVLSLAVGSLVREGKIASVDEPVSSFYPEWKQGRKRTITIRQLLNHTSGLQNELNAGAEIYPSPDFVQLALAAELTDEPGKRFAYNNKALNLLTGVVQKASGKRLDSYLRDGLFKQMGITDFSWTLDPAGNPHGMSGLQIRPADLAKLGQLMLQEGRWNDQQLLSPEWVAASVRADPAVSPTYGYLWWLIPESITYVIDDAQISKLAAAGVDVGFVNRARQIRGSYIGRESYNTALKQAFGNNWQQVIQQALGQVDLGLSAKHYSQKIIGYLADGYLGQYLVVYPQYGLVAVRMVRNSPSYNAATDGFADFETRVLQLVTPH
ncbi:serine hydrolase [Hymenobacter sp.]|uniref:serine hydrolase domain-containing protein n=1 Tax=Hymenobacter sp. TaxID=1898978 RepID=UPI00286D10D2|nr:serine hydrolase [Hymenobacter sp.]